MRGVINAGRGVINARFARGSVGRLMLAVSGTVWHLSGTASGTVLGLNVHVWTKSGHSGAKRAKVLNIQGQ